MDFKAILQKEIARKRQKIEKDSDILAPNKKYFKRGDLAAKEQEEYWRKHKRLIEPDSGQDSPKASDSTADSNDENVEEEKCPTLPRKEVIRRFRDRNEPIRLFGESDYEAFLRLKRIETLATDAPEEGFKNDFKAAMDQVDQEYYKEIVKAATEGDGKGGSVDVSIKDDGTTLEDLQKMKEELETEDTEKQQDIILRFLKYVLKEWGSQLNKRQEDAKKTLRGKEASAFHTQSVSYLKPLFKNLKHKNTDVDILDSLVIIVKHLIERDYIKANEAYLEMAIGNAPWPIGVTMVGIHARTGREKISSRHIAHVLNDETQRKYIQALKRLMLQCQKIFPTDPSFSVNYERPKD
ncbi:hypothetical protein FSP39_024082 [Pinctada imbricata]|uniref:Pre-mRNA-splicing factor 18 n=1 Tax=Pinctada imbricata TaxID=66713 RepID=A0AA88YPT9_PINIB|nr:hypothetical protein FSP39_024082 [Pinctada imbricata]